MKRVLKWLLILGALVVVVVVILFCSRDAILRRVAINNIKSQTGMIAEIGTFHAGLRDSVVSIKDFKLHNPAGFGDAPWLVIPEVTVELDQLALAEKKLHFSRVRFNLGELDLVKNLDGQTNLFAFGLKIPSQTELKKNDGLAELKRQTGYDFTGVDELVVSVGKVKFIDLQNPKNNREQLIDIENQTIKNVKTPMDLAGLGLLLALRSDGFFTDVFGAEALRGWQ